MEPQKPGGWEFLWPSLIQTRNPVTGGQGRDGPDDEPVLHRNADKGDMILTGQVKGQPENSGQGVQVMMAVKMCHPDAAILNAPDLGIPFGPDIRQWDLPAEKAIQKFMEIGREISVFSGQGRIPAQKGFFSHKGQMGSHIQGRECPAQGNGMIKGPARGHEGGGGNDTPAIGFGNAVIYSR